MDEKFKKTTRIGIIRIVIPIFSFFFFLTDPAFCQLGNSAALPAFKPQNDTAFSNNDPYYEASVNVKFLKHLNRVELERAMGFISESLGIKCSYCHVSDNFSSEKKDGFKKSRQMIRMVQWALESYLKKNSLTCFSCHAGTTAPPKLPENWERLPDLSGKNRPRRLPADSYTNVRRLAHLSESEYVQVMSFFVESVGARDCTACHNPENFASDEKKRKTSARKMIELVQNMNPMFFDLDRVTCYTCHRGDLIAETLPEGWSPAENQSP